MFKVNFVSQRNFSFASSVEEARKMIRAAAKTCGLTLEDRPSVFFERVFVTRCRLFARIEKVEREED